jgi:hypothetical protein
VHLDPIYHHISVGSHPPQSICASSSGGQSASVSFGTYDTGSGAFVDLAKPVLLNGAVTGAIGAIVVSTQVAASSNATLTISFGWNFPLRDHFGKVLGNYYKNLFATSSAAAFGNVAPAVHSLYTHYTPTIHSLYTHYTLTIHPLYTHYTPTIHPLYTQVTWPRQIAVLHLPAW